jgi:DNA invertase Pin-like site-specific DNA recombinase
MNSLTTKLATAANINADDEQQHQRLPSYEINRILAFNPATNEYTIEWSDKSISNEPVENASQPAIDAFNTIQTHNATVMQNCQQQGIQPAAQKAYIMIRCSVAKNSSVVTQRLALMNFCLQNNILIDYYSIDKGVSGRYNKRSECMNNLNYEFGYRLPSLTNNHILVINSIDRLGRHAETIMDIIKDLMERGVIIAVIDIETVITPDNFKNRNMHMKIYELAYNAQALSDEISKRVRKSIEIRKQDINTSLNKQPATLMYNKKLVNLTMDIYKKYDAIHKLSKIIKIQRTFNEIVKIQNSDEFIKNLKISKAMITKIIKNQSSDNKITFDKDDKLDEPTAMESDNKTTLISAPTFNIMSYIANIKSFLGIISS